MEDISSVNLPLLQKLKMMLFALSTTRLIIFALLLLFVATLPSLALLLLNPDLQFGGPGWGADNVGRMILWGCVLAPLLETIVHQWACLRILEKLRVRASVAIVLSSLGFAAAHDYSVPYMLTAFFSGVVLSTVFVVERKKRGYPFLATLAVHALKNWIVSAHLLLA
ncbi:MULTISPECIES: CPBP family intramembrane glutamic endopeptidase [unclassified Caballeronia]|uniref:CPBP family intramembrane glutamic endopeptidase n=1 Tax=unclassified Caballeronia TaxID=2646786 RepID=UPI00286209C8|nr:MULTISPECIES: CPBP family intramembrane glutamic endopeptidase [unclassified Caballeronia]MDR5753862.1 CPBP family intramembrane metalloprotease [Caballeronia sp. LZ024]MDR5840241.1 CPBP family intramembrane metalloprotease [Caballeronia sp. LZ031]